MQSFINTETGVSFQFECCGQDESVLAPAPHGGKNMVYGHKVYVGDVIGQGWRHALVLGGVAYVIVDERETDGRSWFVSEKWPIKRSV
jgi:hypothetical protein